MRQISLVAGLLVLSSAAFAADPQLLNMVMPGAKALAGANVNNTLISPFGQFVISKVSALGAEPQKLMAGTGFNPLQDVTEVLAASTAGAGTPTGLLMAKGTFNLDKLTTLATAAKFTQSTPYPGVTLLSLTDAKTNVTRAVALIGNTIAVAGDLASVQTALAQNAAPSATPLFDSTLLAAVTKLSASQDEWMASSVSVASMIPAGDSAPTGIAAQVLPILKSIQSFSSGISFAANVQVSGEVVTSDPQNATALAGVLKLATMMASMSGTNQSSPNNPQLAELSQLLQTLTVTTNGSAVDVSLAIPESQVETLINTALKTSATPAAPRDAQPRRRVNGN